MQSIHFVVYGTPQSQGSIKAFIPKGWNRPVLTSTNKNLKVWRQELSKVALAEMKSRGLTMWGKGEAVFAEVTFYFQRPQSNKKGTHKTTKPDIDKLIRSVLDGMTSIVYHDDSQVTAVSAEKVFGTPERVEVKVRDIIRT